MKKTEKKTTKNKDVKKESKKEVKTSKVSIVIPVFNEKKLVIDVLKKVREVKIPNATVEIIVVDDYSTDGTREILEKDGLKYADKVLYHEVNKGKGAGLRTGFKETTGDVVIVQDADFEYDPMEIPSVVKPILDGECDVCYGSRFLEKEYKGYKQNQLANKVLTGLSNFMTGLKVTDMETCYKAFKGDLIRSIDIKENRFGFEPEITAKMSKKKVKLIEVPIHYYPRTKEEGKKIKLKDGFRALYCIAKYKIKG
ncbi:MAG: glycosyltransferase family 2 protein [Bacilli bacterium]|nr:glycosyltransferase family 2 protein [Bacilli bacterium]